ncbi:MAG TPA: hypothetical protein VK436_07965 [Methanocella sp.]|nr:hypothetical protein [Methanocella sp.]
MIRKITAIIILLLIITSLAASPIANADTVQTTDDNNINTVQTTDDNNVNTVYYNDSGQMPGSIGFRATPILAEEAGANLDAVSDLEDTMVVVDMTGSRLITPGQFTFDEARAPPPHFWLVSKWVSTDHNNGSYIDGVSVKVYHKGVAVPGTFPVRFESIGDPADSEHKFVAHKKLDTSAGVLDFQGTIMLNSNGSVIDGTALTKNSEYNNTISQGDDNWHTVTVGSSTASLNINVKWQNSSDNLRLMIYTADGYTLGPYYDSSDGKTDGQILVNVSNSAGLSPGQWYLKVTGSDVAGKDAYYVKAY